MKNTWKKWVAMACVLAMIVCTLPALASHDSDMNSVIQDIEMALEQSFEMEPPEEEWDVTEAEPEVVEEAEPEVVEEAEPEVVEEAEPEVVEEAEPEIEEEPEEVEEPVQEPAPVTEPASEEEPEAEPESEVVPEELDVTAEEPAEDPEPEIIEEEPEIVEEVVEDTTPVEEPAVPGAPEAVLFDTILSAYANGTVDIHAKPDEKSEVLYQAEDGTELLIAGEIGEWLILADNAGFVSVLNVRWEQGTAPAKTEPAKEADKETAPEAVPAASEGTEEVLPESGSEPKTQWLRRPAPQKKTLRPKRTNLRKKPKRKMQSTRPYRSLDRKKPNRPEKLRSSPRAEKQPKRFSRKRNLFILTPIRSSESPLPAERPCRKGKWFT